jgi:hypothetical protein
VGCVDPVVGAAAHDMVAVDVALVDGHLGVVSECMAAKPSLPCRKRARVRTLLYVAE